MKAYSIVRILNVVIRLAKFVNNSLPTIFTIILVYIIIKTYPRNEPSTDDISHEFPNIVPRYVMNCAQNNFTPSKDRYSKYELDSSFQVQPFDSADSEIDLILVWTRFFDWEFLYDAVSDTDRFIYNPNESVHRPAYCSRMYPNCRITDRKRFYNQSDLVLFHWIDLNLNEIPHHRNPNQIWELFIHEPPHRTPELPSTVLIDFNATALYHSGSDMIIPYGETERFENPHYKAKVHEKSHPIVWFVSHCETPSKREKYVMNLKKYIRVSVFGACAKFLQCAKRNWNHCQERAFSNHYFYLSFENSMCDQYATEKLFSVLNYDIVPIVYGGADYSSILPPHSFIDATKYRPRELARLVTSLMANRTAYLQYFEWKKHFRVRGDRHANDHMICEACRYIRQYKLGLIPKKSISLRQINRFWWSTCWNQHKIDQLSEYQ